MNGVIFSFNCMNCPSLRGSHADCCTSTSAGGPEISCRSHEGSTVRPTDDSQAYHACYLCKHLAYLWCASARSASTLVPPPVSSSSSLLGQLDSPALQTSGAHESEAWRLLNVGFERALHQSIPEAILSKASTVHRCSVRLRKPRGRVPSSARALDCKRRGRA